MTLETQKGTQGKSVTQKPRANKQKEMGAASLLRMAKDARKEAEAARVHVGVDPAFGMALEAFAEIHEAEAKRLRAMR